MMNYEPRCSDYDPHAVEDGRCECGPDACPNAYRLAAQAECNSSPDYLREMGFQAEARAQAMGWGD